MRPRFETLYDPHESMMLADAYDAITACDLWEWLRNYTTDTFMFAAHPNLDRISKEMKFHGHSGASWGMTMRAMESIAKYGWEAHALGIRRTIPRDPCPCRAAKGYTVGWCGVAGGGVPGCEH